MTVTSFDASAVAQSTQTRQFPIINRAGQISTRPMTAIARSAASVLMSYMIPTLGAIEATDRRVSSYATIWTSRSTTLSSTLSLKRTPVLSSGIICGPLTGRNTTIKRSTQRSSRASSIKPSQTLKKKKKTSGLPLTGRTATTRSTSSDTTHSRATPLVIAGTFSLNWLNTSARTTLRTTSTNSHRLSRL